MKIDPRLFRFLWAIEEHGTFIRAARAEGISQPALSSKIAILEQQLGTKLIDRGRHGARLNSFGRLLLRHARAIDAIVDRAAEEVRTSVEGSSGMLVLGGTPISMIEIIPKSLDQLVRQNDNIRVSLVEADDDILLDRLRAGEIELMLGGLLAGETGSDIIESPLVNFPLRAVIGRANKFWNRDAISLDELLTQAWALPDSGSVIRSYVDAIFVNAGASVPASHWSCSSMHGLKAVIQHTDRVTVMPGHALDLEERTGVLKTLTLKGPTSNRRLNILRMRHLPLSPVAESFVTHVRRMAETIARR